jgi:hypothetical protein
MKLRNICVSALAVSMFLGASAVSAKTAKCYKNPGNNNGHRFVVDYRSQYHDVIVTKEIKQEWRGGRYVDVVTTWHNPGKVIRWTTFNPSDVCKNLYNYRYSQH